MENDIQVFAVKHKNIDIRMSSRSGGFFTALSDNVLLAGGVVYGCILDEEFKASHIRTDNIEGRDMMRGSKYIQSDLKNIFFKVKEDLDNGLFVLFTGTSCQVSGLKSFLNYQYEKLICVDIVCHGVPSPKVFKNYIKWQEEKNAAKCVGIDFRNKKKFGWEAHVETLIMEKDEGIFNIDSEVFKTLFYSHNIIRPSCSYCPYKDITHPGDITIADYWGIDKAAPGFNDNKGVSLVLVNNIKGQQLFCDIKDKIEFRECNIKDSMQEPLIRPFPMPKSRRRFWKDYNKYSFEIVAKKYGKVSKFKKFKNIIANIMYKIKNKLSMGSD